MLPSFVCGPKAGLIVRGLAAIEVRCDEVPPDGLLYELVKKSLYILTVNIAGLAMPPGGTVGELWRNHRELAEAIAGEVLDIQEWLAGCALPREKLIAGLLESFNGDLQHICRGRSAPERLRRALALAQDAGLHTPTLQTIL